MTTFSHTYDKTTPVGTDAPSVLDNRDRETKLAVQERENVDHYWPYASSADVAGGNEVASAYTGEHRKITFYGNITDPTQVTGKGHLYMKDGELFYQDASNTALQLTNAGVLYSGVGLTVVGNATVGGTLVVTGVATLGDSSQMATSAAPTADADLANKKYVDDQIAAYIASEVTLSAYTDEDSDSNTLVKAHAYLAATGGEVYVRCALATNGNNVKGYIGATTDPAGAGTLIQTQEAAKNSDTKSFCMSVGESQYFEITTPDSPIILWRSRGTLSKPVDQD